VAITIARAVDARAASTCERVAIDELRVAADAVRLGNALDAVEHEAHEAVALALHARHHLAAVDAHRAVDVHAEARRALDGVRGLGRGDEQLRRHAAHARAGGAVGAALDDDARGAGGLAAR
jgi:hypothetical protein